MKTHIRKAVIPVAGLGTRFLPATKSIPKEMIPIIDKPMIQYIIEECVDAGITDIILVTARGKDSIADHFDHSFEVESHLEKNKKTDLLEVTQNVSKMVNLICVRQKTPMGLGHAVLSAKAAVGNEPFAILLGDDLVIGKTPCIRQLIDVYEKNSKSVIGVMNVERREVSKYGIIGGNEISKGLHRVNQMVEKPSPTDAPSTLACPGRYVLSPEIFDLLSHAKPGKGGEIQLTDSLSMLAEKSGLLAYEFEGKRYDTGDKLGYLEATIAFALSRSDLSENFKKIYLNSSCGTAW